MVGIPLGLLTANATEWLVHKYLLHGRGRKKGSFWAFHWHEHHRSSNRYAFRDPSYVESVFGWHAQGKEAATLVGASLAVLPLMPIAPTFTLTLLYSAVNYYRKHKRSHLDPQWAREHLPWHYDHHMGPNPDANWCVTRPWFDHIMGTREIYLGTPKEATDRARRQARAAAAA